MKPISLIYSYIAVALTFHGVCSPPGTELVVQSNNTWTAKIYGAAQGWNTDINFTDSNWVGTTIGGTINNRGSNFEATPLIWHAGARAMGNNKGMRSGAPNTYFRKVFNLNTVPALVLMDVLFDDYGDVYINGNLVYSDPSSCSTSETAINKDVTPYLQEGNNLIAVHALSCDGQMLMCLNLRSMPILKTFDAKGIEFQSELGITYVLEASDNLINWVEVERIEGNNEKIVRYYTEEEASGLYFRVYLAD